MKKNPPTLQTLKLNIYCVEYFLEIPILCPPVNSVLFGVNQLITPHLFQKQI